jgi:hypothetical protein
MTEFLKSKDLPPFDELGDCPKCAGTSVKVIYHGFYKRGFPCKVEDAWVKGEHMCRICGRCGHGWCEAPADVKPPVSRGGLRVVRECEPT